MKKELPSLQPFFKRKTTAIIGDLLQQAKLNQFAGEESKIIGQRPTITRGLLSLSPST
ncbi:MAG: hypothetical protein IPJ20_05530 [Flammeovirgaceae bacterium]|nr:hypothetical protein [Flammeovirgaceae bacterium]